MKRRFEHHASKRLFILMNSYPTLFNMIHVVLFYGVQPDDSNHDECCNDG